MIDWRRQWPTATFLSNIEKTPPLSSKRQVRPGGPVRKPADDRGQRAPASTDAWTHVQSDRNHWCGDNANGSAERAIQPHPVCRRNPHRTQVVPRLGSPFHSSPSSASLPRFRSVREHRAPTITQQGDYGLSVSQLRRREHSGTPLQPALILHWPDCIATGVVCQEPNERIQARASILNRRGSSATTWHP